MLHEVCRSVQVSEQELLLPAGQTSPQAATSCPQPLIASAASEKAERVRTWEMRLSFKGCSAVWCVVDDLGQRWAGDFLSAAFSAFWMSLSAAFSAAGIASARCAARRRSHVVTPTDSRMSTIGRRK